MGAHKSDCDPQFRVSVHPVTKVVSVQSTDFVVGRLGILG